MIRQTKIFLLLVLVFMIAVGQIDGLANATETGKVIDVKISSDLHKVMIKTQGDVGRHSTSLLDRPPRLVVDFPATGLDLSQGLKAEQREDGLTIRTAKTPSGVRVVLDFGRGRVPEHKIHRMGNDLILFLEDWSAPATAPDTGVQAEKPLARPSGPPVVTRQPAPSPSATPELEIKSTQVSGGMIVLKVADPKEPGNIYRVELGLDLDRLGFTSARIVPPAGQRTSSGPAPAQVQVVPRQKADGPAPRAQVYDYSSNRNAAEDGALQAPGNGPMSGRASQARCEGRQDTANEQNQSLLVPTQNRLPRQQSVTESLRAKFYGQAPAEAAPSNWSSNPQAQEPVRQRTAPVPAQPSRQAGTASIHNAVDRVLGY